MWKEKPGHDNKIIMQELLCNFFNTKVKKIPSQSQLSIIQFTHLYLLRVLLLSVDLNAVEKNSLD